MAKFQRPRLPQLLAFPAALLPEKIHSHVSARVMTHLFSGEMAEGELDFMQGRTVRIRVDDAKIGFCLSLQGNRFIAIPQQEQAELTINGTLYDYLLLVSGREDPDTLFFQRHLSMQGDTELGVHLKNFLSGIDMESLPLPKSMQPMMEKGLGLYERFV
jgi:predicted lipid carrier protein YhbT